VSARPHLRIVNERVTVRPARKKKKTWTMQHVTPRNHLALKKQVWALKEVIRKLKKRLQNAGI